MVRLIIIWFLLTNFLFSKVLEKKRFLVLQSYHTTLPWTIDINEGLKKSIQKYDNKIELFVEHFDYIRLGEVLTAEKIEEIITQKYNNIKFDGVLIESYYAAKVYNKFGYKYNLKIPHVYAVEEKIELKGNSINISKEKNINIIETLNLIKKLHPKSKKILFIESEDGDFSKTKKEILLNSDVEVEIYNDFTLQELYQKIKTLPKNTIVLYSLVIRDKTNLKTVPRKVLDDIIKISSNPIYSLHSSLLGEGVVGGHVINAQKVAISMVDAIMDYINKNEFKKQYLTSETILNWDMIKKFNIDESNLPSNVILHNKPKTILESFFYETILTIFFISILILFLILLIKLNMKLKVETEEKILKQELLNQQSKNALMGEMINSIAHQWRQPLARINSNIAVIELLSLKSENKDLIEDKLLHIENQTSYMSNTIDDFSNFFSPDKKKITFNLSSSIKKAIALLSSRLKNVHIKYGMDEELKINSYENEFTQVILAIVNNSVDNFILKKIDKPILKIILKKVNDIIIIDLIDNGGGIEESIITKIFEAHYTTKKEVKSTGLGLYISKNIIETSMKGNITAFNKANGIVFRITFDKGNK